MNENLSANNPNGSDSDFLDNILSEKTETKNPLSSAKAPYEEDDFWDIPLNTSNDFKKQIQNKEVQSTNSNVDQGKRIITEGERNASAQASTAMFNMLLTGGFTFFQNQKFNNKFSSEQKNTLESVQDKEDSSLTPAELALKRKYLKAEEIHNKKLDRIPLSDKQKKDLEEALSLYFKIKNISMPPEWLLIFTVGQILGSRGIDLAVD